MYLGQNGAIPGVFINMNLHLSAYFPLKDFCEGADQGDCGQDKQSQEKNKNNFLGIEYQPGKSSRFLDKISSGLFCVISISSF